MPARETPGRYRALARRLVLTAGLAGGLAFEGRIPFARREWLRALQERRIGKVAELATRTVPHYREARRTAGLDAADIRTAADLARIPVVRRESLQRDPERFISERAERGDLIAVRSSASTDEPITFMRDTRSLFIRDLNLRRFTPLVAAVTGKRFRRRVALLIAPAGASERVNRAFEERRLISTGRIDHRTLSILTPTPEVIRALDAFRPDVVTAYGSYLEELFIHLLGSGEPHHRPALAVFGADPLSSRLRDEAARRLGIRTLGIYQAVETPMIGFECGRGRGYHLNVDLCPVRILDEEEREVAPGEPGEVVVSNLVNRGTMLLNYALGDRAALVPGRCQCGRTLPLLKLLEGRTSDWLLAAGGKRVSPIIIHHAVIRHLGVWRYQIVQERVGSVRIRAVIDPRADAAALARRLGEDAERSVGAGLAVAVEPVEMLSRTEAGKTKVVIPSEEGR